MSLPLGYHVPDYEIGDELDRCYTPPKLARAVVRVAAELLPAPPRLIVEPSVGSGIFVDACRELWPGARFVVVDYDPAAVGLKLPGVRALVGDWSLVANLHRDEIEAADLVIGNLPFSEALAQVPITLQACPRAAAAFILPASYPGVGEWQAVLGAPEARPTDLWPILGRPWPKRVRETQVYGWEAPRVGPRHTIATRYHLPALAWATQADGAGETT